MQPNEREQRIFASYLRRPGRRRLARVVEAFRAHVWSVALRVTGNPDDAADISQDVFLALLLSPPAAGTVRSPRGFLAFSVINSACRRRRGQARMRRREMSVARSVVEEEKLPLDDLEPVREAIQELPERIQTAICLRYFEGMHNDEVADLLGVSSRTVEDDLRRGRDLLRARLGATAFSALAAVGIRGAAALEGPPAAVVQALQAIVASGASLSQAAIAAPGKSLVAGAGIASTLVIVAAIWLQGGFRGGETTPPVSSPPGNPLAQGPTVGAQPGNAPALTQDGADQISAARGGDAASVTKTHEVMYTGWVVDEQGTPVTGAQVAVYASPLNLRSGSRPRLCAEGRSDADGSFLVAWDAPEVPEHHNLVATRTGLAMGWAQPRRFLYAHGAPVETLIEGVIIVLARQSAVLEGRLRTEEGRPIEGALVVGSVRSGAGVHFTFDAETTGPGTATSAADGTFRVEGLPPGAPVDLRVEHEAHLPLYLRHAVPGGRPLELTLARGVSVEGTVTDTRGRPLPGVPVRLEESVDRRTRFRDAETSEGVTDENGIFRLTAWRGNYSLTFQTTLEHEMAPPLELQLDSDLSGLRIVVESRAWIEGLALDEASVPIANAPIVVRAGGQDRPLRSLADGSFRCAVTPGEVLALPGDESDFPWRPVEGDAFRERVEDGRTLRTARVRFHARADDGSEGSLQRARDLRASAASNGVSIRVVGPEGRPVLALVAASTDVEASDRGFSHTTFETLTAPTGECRLKVQGWPARILACVPARGLYFQTVLTGGKDELLAELLPVGECRIAGRLTLPGGTAVPRAGIIVSRQIDTVDMLVGTETGVTDDEGRFLLPGLLPFTRYRLTPVVGITHGPAKLVTTTPGATLEVDLELPAADAELEGSVTGRDGKPLPGIIITYDYSEDELPDWKTTTTDASGGFLARNLLPGRYSLAVDQPGFEVWGSEAQAPGPPLRIVLRTTRVIRFALELESGLRVRCAAVIGQQTRNQWVCSGSGEYEVEVDEAEEEISIDAQGHVARRALDFDDPDPCDLGTIVLRPLPPGR